MLSVRVKERDTIFHSARVVAITHVSHSSYSLYVLYKAASFPVTFINRRDNVHINVTLRSVSVTIVTVEKEKLLHILNVCL